MLHRRSLAACVALVMLVIGWFAPRATAAAGPWRGQVIDAHTGEPLPGAVVVGVWNRRARGHPGIGLGAAARFAVEEVVTGADGRFLLPARGLVTPPLVVPVDGPDLLIFKAGYGGWRFAGQREDLTTRGGAIIQMRPLTAVDERLKYIDRRMSERDARWGHLQNGRGPGDFHDLPSDRVPRYEAAVNAERLLLGRVPDQYVGAEDVMRGLWLRAVVPAPATGVAKLVAKWGDGTPHGPSRCRRGPADG